MEGAAHTELKLFGPSAASETYPMRGGIDNVIYTCSFCENYKCKCIQISPAESVVMEVLWQEHPQSAENIVTALQGKQPWQATTIKTLLSRLLKKGAITRAKQGPSYLYRPCLQRDQYLLAESSGIIDRLFGGRIAPLVARLSEHRKLSQKDIDELQRLIDEMQHGR